MSAHHDLLTSAPLDGPSAITRILGPTPVARLVRADSWDDAVAGLSDACSDWGGAMNVLVPVLGGVQAVPPVWECLLADSDVAGTFTRGILPVPERQQVTYGGSWHAGSGGKGLLSVLAHLPEADRAWAAVQSAHVLDPDDPWYLAYLAVWGALRQDFDVKTLMRLDLRRDLKFSDLVDVEGAPQEPLGHRHLLASIRHRRRITAADLSCTKLLISSAPTDGNMGGHPLLPLRGEMNRRVGPNVIVVYEPGSVEDLCLIWQLRAAHGLPAGYPLAIPVTADVDAALKYWGDERAMKLWGIGSPHCMLVSASVNNADLAKFAARAASYYHVGSIQEILQPSARAGYWSEETVVFNNGRAKIPASSPSEISQFGLRLLTSHSMGLELTIIPDAWQLPPSATMRRDRAGETRYHRGVIVGYRGPRTFVEASYVTGFDVMYASARDRGVDCAPSNPGIIAENFISKIGFEHLYLLLSPKVSELLLTLCERRGASYFNRRLRNILKKEAIDVADGTDRLTRIEELLRRQSGPPEDFDKIELAFGKIKNYLGGAEAASSWLEWAETNELILRGAVVECPRCQGRNWHPLSAIAPPIPCRSCAHLIDRPFKYDSLPFTYRASELLLRLVSTDALVHVLAQRFFTELFRPGFNRIGPIFGGYPGLNFMEPGSSIPFGEADVFFILADGGVGVGECKTRAAGLVEEELNKLDRLADRLQASFTFVATLDSADQCGPNWRTNPSKDGRPHFALTAEHLYDFHPFAAMGQTSPLEWRESYVDLAGSPIDISGLLKDFTRHLVSHNEWKKSRDLPWWRQNLE